MSEKERNTERADVGETEEPVQDSSDDDFEAHRDIARDVERDVERDEIGRDEVGRNID